jgi:hypothetical protein
MRSSILAGFLGTALVLGVAPAEAAWHGYFVKEGVGFSFTAPGDMKPQKIKYMSAMAGERDAVVFGSVEDNVEYKVLVVDFAGRTSDEAALIKEATTFSQDKKKVLMDEDARVESSYGRKLTVDLPNNTGRAMSAIFFKDNHLVQLQATVLPGGDLLSSDMGRFVDSLAFYETRKDEGAIELKLTD